MTRVEAKQLSQMMLTMGRNLLRLSAALQTMAEPTKKPKKKAGRARRAAGAEFSTF